MFKIASTSISNYLQGRRIKCCYQRNLTKRIENQYQREEIGPPGDRGRRNTQPKSQQKSFWAEVAAKPRRAPFRRRHTTLKAVSDLRRPKQWELVRGSSAKPAHCRKMLCVQATFSSRNKGASFAVVRPYLHQVRFNLSSVGWITRKYQ